MLECISADLCVLGGYIEFHHCIVAEYAEASAIAAGVVLDILEEEEILSEFFLGDEVGRLVVVLGELADGADIGLLGSLGETSELKTLDHSLSKLGHHDTSCWIGKLLGSGSIWTVSFGENDRALAGGSGLRASA